ncbi:MAG: PAS domain-containing protein [Myxococcales bacterium]|nr:PAS domain-containing protein [Myxococcales bacterium]
MESDGERQLLQVIADHLPVMVSYWGRDGVCRFSNRAYDAWLFGGQPVRGKRLRDILDGDRLAVGEALMRDVLAGQPRRFSRKGVGPDGVHRMMEVTSVPHAVDGDVVGVVTVVYDVSTFEQARRTASDENVELTARVAARTAELAASEAFVRAIADNVPTSLAYWDRDLRCRFANRVTREMLRAEAPEGGGLHELIAASHAGTAEVALRAALGGTRQDYEREVVTRDGTRIYQVSLVPHAVDGEVRGVVAVGVDVTERHRAGAELARRERQFRSMIEGAPLAVLAADVAGQITLANDGAARMFGYPPGSLVGMPIEALVPEEGRGGHAAHRASYLDTMVPRRMGQGREVFGRRADGSTFPIEVALSTSETADGLQVLAHIADISERMRLQQERAEVARKLTSAQHTESLGVLAGGIAHDFNNLLTGVLGSASLLLETVDASDLSLVMGIRTAAERAAELCRQLLAYAGRGTTLVARIDLSQLVRETSQLIASSVNKRAALRLQLASGGASVNADAVQLRQVVMNLVINAGEAIGAADGEITVSTGTVELGAAELATAALAEDAEPGRFAYVEVVDTGAGIAHADQPRIFEPFYSTKFTGRGLGLAAVRGILRTHRGVLFLDSEPGRGSRFRVCLPALAPMPRVVGARGANLAWRGHGRCLVIDDEPAVRTLCQAALERLGFSVDLASDGDVGLAQFEEDPMAYALVLVDLSMPRLGGVETYVGMRRLRPDVPVVLMSGNSGSDLHDDLGASGRYVFVAKPFDLQALSAAIRKVLGDT